MFAKTSGPEKCTIAQMKFTKVLTGGTALPNRSAWQCLQMGPKKLRNPGKSLLSRGQYIVNGSRKGGAWARACNPRRRPGTFHSLRPVKPERHRAGRSGRAQASHLGHRCGRAAKFSAPFPVIEPRLLYRLSIDGMSTDDYRAPTYYAPVLRPPPHIAAKAPLQPEVLQERRNC